jgi:hypothetical protein
VEKEVKRTNSSLSPSAKNVVIEKTDLNIKFIFLENEIEEIVVTF